MFLRLVSLLFFCVLGCSSPTPALVTEPHLPPSEPVFEGPLVDYLPAGGVNWILLGKPAQIASNEALRRTLEPLLPPARLDHFAQETGIDLRTLDSALVAGFDLGTLYLAETAADLTTAARAFSERLVTAPQVEQPHPRLQRISGVVGRTPQSFLGFDGKLVAVGVGDTTTIRIVEAFARQKLKRTKRAFEGIALQSLDNFGKDAPLVFVVPGPFEDKWIYGAGGLMAAATAMGISARPIDGKVIEFVVAIDGPWEETTQPVAKIRQAWEALAQSSTGRLFGLNQPTDAPKLSMNKQRIQLEVRLGLRPIVNGLKAAVSADVWEMLDLPPTSTQAEGNSEAEEPTRLQ